MHYLIYVGSFLHRILFTKFWQDHLERWQFNQFFMCAYMCYVKIEIERGLHLRNINSCEICALTYASLDIRVRIEF